MPLLLYPGSLNHTFTVIFAARMAEGDRFCISTRGAQKLALEGSKYTRERTLVSGKRIWRYEDRSCRERAHTIIDGIISSTQAHHHSPTPLGWRYVYI